MSQNELQSDRVLIRTKLNMPRLAADILERPHLVTRLNQGLGRKLTLVAAPAGYGKSTLIASWLRQQQRPVAWLSLDKYDSDLRVFIRYLLEAIRTFSPQACPETERLLDIGHMPPADMIDILARTLINEISDLTAPAETLSSSANPALVIVLEDYHHIHEHAIHQVVGELINYQPWQIHLVIISRQEPVALPLVTLRARRDMLELRTQELAFDLDETREFLTHTMGLDAADETARVLATKTEGWAVGVRLASLSLRNFEDPADFLQSLTATDKLLMSYLLDEVLAQQPRYVQEFLLQSSILDRFCASLIDAIMVADEHKTGGEQYLDWLEHANLFVVTLDNQHQWYRYHRLFQSLLIHKLESEWSSERLQGLHRRASHWLADEGYVDESIHHAVMASDFSLATEIIQKNYWEPLNRGMYWRIERWMSYLPEDTIMSNVYLQLVRVIPATADGNYAVALPSLARIEALLMEQAPQLDPLEVARLQLLTNIQYLSAQTWLGDVDAGIDNARRLLDRLPEQKMGLVGIVLGLFSLLLHMKGETDNAMTMLLDKIEGASPEADIAYVSHLKIGLCAVAWEAGRLHEFTQANKEHLRSTPETNYTPRGWAHYLFGCYYYQMNELSAAKEHFEAAVRQPHFNLLLQLLHSYFGLALTYQALGDATTAMLKAETALDTANKSDSPQLIWQSELFQDRLRLLQGEPVLPQHYDPANDFEGLHVPPLFLIESSQFQILRLLIAEATSHSLTRAESLLRPLYTLVESRDAPLALAETLVIQATLHIKRQQERRAVDSLLQAIAIAERIGARRLFVDTDAQVATLLHTVRTQSRQSAPFVDQILAILHQEGPSIALGGDTHATYLSASQSLVDPLTDRELDVLSLLAQRRSYKEIALSLVISPKTVKTHVSRIYRKLEVNRRQQAVAKAQLLKLIPTSEQ